jgi:hypothetical protein
MIPTEQPKWFYKLIEIENLIEIQEELKNVIYKLYPHFDHGLPKFFYHPRDTLESLVPKYMSYMDTIGVLNRWRGSSVISTNYGIKFPIHIDSENWLEVSYALNIPVINCEGTYTVWYDATVSDRYVNAVGVPKERMTKYIDNTKPITEVERLEMIQPAWINISIPQSSLFC